MFEKLYLVAFELCKVKGSGHNRKGIIIDNILEVCFYISKQIFLDSHWGCSRDSIGNGSKSIGFFEDSIAIFEDHLLNFISFLYWHDLSI